MDTWESVSRSLDDVMRAVYQGNFAKTGESKREAGTSSAVSMRKHARMKMGRQTDHNSEIPEWFVSFLPSLCCVLMVFDNEF